ncbi:MAG: SIMPL domain-containing protein [Bacteroidota bacterium]
MKHLFAFALLFFILNGYAQNPKPKSIEVLGKAQRTITPDELFLRITLKEYKSGNSKVNMNTLEASLVSALKEIKGTSDDLTVDNIYGYNWNWKKKKTDEYLATKSFRLKLSDVQMVNDLIEKIDQEGLNSINLAKVSHSRIDEIQLELKAEALKNAKEKAKFLLEAVDETVGSTLEIQEINYGYESPVYARGRAFDTAEASVGYQSNLEFRSIEIEAEFRVVFEIK